MRPSGAVFSISDLAREFAITPRTIRFWEDQGILAPQREGNKRVFTRRAACGATPNCMKSVPALPKSGAC